LILGGCAVDRRGPFATPGYVQAVEAIQRGPGPTRGEGAYRVGWSRVEIAIPAGVALAGYGDRGGAPHEGIRDPAYVRAFAIRAGDATVVLYAADLLLIDPLVVHSVYSGLGDAVRPGSLLFTASHTHSGPGGFVPGLLYELVFGPYDPAAFDAVVAAHVQAAQQAIAALAPGRIGFAEVRAPGLIQNRVETDGPTDDALFVMSFESKGRRAAWWSFGCHAVTLPAANLQISADYPGEVAAMFEGKTHEALGFSAGGVGSSNPLHEKDDHSWLVGPLRDALAEGIATAERSARSKGRIAFLEREVPATPVRYRIGESFQYWSIPIEVLTGIDRLLFRAVAIDDAVILQMPGEMSGTLTAEARATARRNGIKLALTPFNGTYAGYVVPRRVYDLPEAERQEMQPYEAQVMAFFGPYGADVMMNLGMRVAARTHASVTD
jgi:hypothetical protein